MAGLTISETARKAGVGVETIRYYQRIGLMTPPPRPAGGGVRRYTQADLSRLRFIRAAKDLGFTLREIRFLLDPKNQRSADCTEMKELAEAKLEHLRRNIQRLTSMCRVLEQLAEGCPGCGPLDICTLWNHLQSGGNHDPTTSSGSVHSRMPGL